MPIWSSNSSLETVTPYWSNTAERQNFHDGKTASEKKLSYLKDLSHHPMSYQLRVHSHNREVCKDDMCIKQPATIRINTYITSIMINKIIYFRICSLSWDPDITDTVLFLPPAEPHYTFRVCCNTLTYFSIAGLTWEWYIFPANSECSSTYANVFKVLPNADHYKNRTKCTSHLTKALYNSKQFSSFSVCHHQSVLTSTTTSYTYTGWSQSSRTKAIKTFKKTLFFLFIYSK
jgi:hypothetical protein